MHPCAHACGQILRLSGAAWPVDGLLMHVSARPACIRRAVDKLGVNRVGIADTVGVATPLQVYNVIRMVREVISPETGAVLEKCQS